MTFSYRTPLSCMHDTYAFLARCSKQCSSGIRENLSQCHCAGNGAGGDNFYSWLCCIRIRLVVLPWQRPLNIDLADNSGLDS